MLIRSSIDKFQTDTLPQIYICGATAEATKALILIEALEKIYNWTDELDDLYGGPGQLAADALKKYHNNDQSTVSHTSRPG